jgi:glucosamine-6-phosphate deaminase
MIKVFDTEEQLAVAVAKEMSLQLENLPNPVFCLASGSTPANTYKKFTENIENFKHMDKLKFVGLDEWVGVARQVEGSCYQMLHQDLFQYLSLKEEQVVFFDAVSNNLKGECNRIDTFIQNNPITFSLMGVGMNGHIGLNEPGSTVKNHSSIVPLSDTTKLVAKKYFPKEQVLTEGITLGLQQIINSKKVAVVITGSHKKEVVKRILEERDAKLPVQYLLGYQHIDFYIDNDAFALVDKTLIEEY